MSTLVFRKSSVERVLGRVSRSDILSVNEVAGKWTGCVALLIRSERASSRRMQVRLAERRSVPSGLSGDLAPTSPGRELPPGPVESRLPEDWGFAWTITITIVKPSPPMRSGSGMTTPLTWRIEDGPGWGPNKFFGELCSFTGCEIDWRPVSDALCARLQPPVDLISVRRSRVYLREHANANRCIAAPWRNNKIRKRRLLTCSFPLGSVLL